jgi:glycerol-3-phosphate cytidylyltransferase
VTSERTGPVIGYTAGVFDMFHIGHLNLLRNARSRCDHLIVGVTTDELALETKGALPAVTLRDRMEIVQSMRYVDDVVPQVSMDKLEAQRTLNFDVLFVGENMQGTEWESWAAEIAPTGARVVFLPATYDESGQLLERTLDDLREGV